MLFEMLMLLGFVICLIPGAFVTKGERNVH